MSRQLGNSAQNQTVNTAQSSRLLQKGMTTISMSRDKAGREAIAKNNVSRRHRHLKDLTNFHECSLIFLTAFNKECPLLCSTSARLTLKRSCHTGAWSYCDHNVLPHRAVTPLFSCANLGPVLLDNAGNWPCWHERTGLAFSRLHYHAPAPCTGRPTPKGFMAKNLLANFRTMSKTLASLSILKINKMVGIQHNFCCIVKQKVSIDAKLL